MGGLGLQVFAGTHLILCWSRKRAHGLEQQKQALSSDVMDESPVPWRKEGRKVKVGSRVTNPEGIAITDLRSDDGQSSGRVPDDVEDIGSKYQQPIS